MNFLLLEVIQTQILFTLHTHYKINHMICIVEFPYLTARLNHGSVVERSQFYPVDVISSIVGIVTAIHIT